MSTGLSSVTQEEREGKVVNDAVFGFINLKPYIVDIIDTFEFQRMRNIWQLGVAPFVYPTANHSRFEHSIGTYFLASKLVTKLKHQLEDEDADMKITDNDVMCVEIAALCHDIGHGPFSHVWDNIILPGILASTSTPKHETHVKEFLNNKVKAILQKNGIEEGHLNEKIDTIYAYINGKKVKGKELLCYIVSNSDSGMDVDKWDYLARDSMYLGHSSTNYKIEIERMIHLARAINDNGKWKIAFRESESLNMLHVFQLRHHLHKTACQHRVVLAVEQMMLDGFKRHFRNATGLKKKLIATSKWIFMNTDSIFWQNIIKHTEDQPSYDQNNEQSNEQSNDQIIENVEFKRITERDLYKPICEIVKYKFEDDPREEIMDYLIDKKYDVEKDHLNQGTLLKDFRMSFSRFRLSHTESNPLLKIRFYKKNDKKNMMERYTKETLPNNLEYNVDESRITVFTVHGKRKHGEEDIKIRIKKLKKDMKSYCTDTKNGIEWKYQSLWDE